MVDGFLRQIKDAMLGDDQVEPDANYDRQTGSDNEDPYGASTDYGQYGDVQPASEDPYGDPADQAY